MKKVMRMSKSRAKAINVKVRVLKDSLTAMETGMTTRTHGG